MKVSELEGEALDAAVALADGRLVTEDEPGWPAGDLASLRDEFGGEHVVRWYGSSGELGGWEPLSNQGSPSTDWAVGGQIIDRERINLQPVYSMDGRFLYWTAKSREWVLDMDGPTPLIAAMRAYVASKFGEEVPERSIIL